MGMMESISIGIAGLGMAARSCAPAFVRHPGLKIAAAAEPDEVTGAAFSASHEVPAYRDFQALLAHPGLDAVYIATPTPLHAEQTVLALRAGKHVIVEKPMASSLDEAEAMVAAAAAAGRVLLVGHSHSFDLPIRRMRDVIASGDLGAVKMINTWNYTDWVYRPRRLTELDPDQGGSVLFRQGAHQVDIVRLLGGGMLRNVYARTFDLDPERSTIGAHCLMLEFENGAAATAIYNGYGRLSGAELCGGVSEWGFPAPVPQPVAHQGARDEQALKRERVKKADRSGAPFQPHFGLTVVSCERGDLRQSPGGIIVYRPDGREEIALETTCTPHDLVAAEFHDAIRGLAITVHDGRWGLANLEVCNAALRSARSGQAVGLRQQVSVPK
ncbi:Gfo/Idh/MocA family oxidoreductase [Ancylobacter polymorphus]|uniref:Phthalate 4,5-cis-dihydrodiol dehydrogenase n=1 Tax=Ancylobacter polymorphus TaxID=223390 RepID=A0ABU0BGM1_9HYPH|nr:Gfo/Idh/MocA family oxidoreductase [Ancylobacter polymorphus]MDQ0304981.1 phthalate 4,5-cis-dihydrodiol dehydrogenase [Ancylobacter polymorphus]